MNNSKTKILKENVKNSPNSAFDKESIKKFGSVDSAVAVYIDRAWQYYYTDSLDSAMKRFNQAWLLNSDFSDAYFGFAALLETNAIPLM